MEPISDVREISRIAYGFKASKALFVALELGIFTTLSGAPRTLGELSEDIHIAANRLQALLTVLTSLGLLTNDGGSYSNAPASETYLVRNSPAYFGDYFLLQTDQFIFPAFNELGQVVRGEGLSGDWRDYETLMQDERLAERFSRGQHAGSLGPAVALSKQVDLSGRTSLLDVAGGSGAFTIMLCRRNRELAATILDFPAALPVARLFAAEAGLDDRVDFSAGNVITDHWPQQHDVVLMSYLFSAIPQEDLPLLMDKAYEALAPGGLLIVHDFMADDDLSGPRDATLWFLTCMFNCPEAGVLTPELTGGLASEAGFESVRTEDLIPGLTKMTLGQKPTPESGLNR